LPPHPRRRSDRRRRDGRRAGARRARRGDLLCQGAPRLRPTDLEIPVDPGEDRRPLGADRGGAAAHLAGGDGERRKARVHADRGAGDADHRPARGAGDRGGGADPRRLRLHRGVPGVPLLPRREDPDDRRGDRRGPADGDRAAVGLLMPGAVKIREVGPRDGFQNEPEVIATDDKVRLVEMLAATGLRRLEVTSFVRADVVPQLADAGEVLERARIPEEVSVSVLIPNRRGLEGALAPGDRIDEVNVFLSASESHNRHNVNRSVAESVAGAAAVFAEARAAWLRCEGVISTSFGCPYEGD